MTYFPCYYSLERVIGPSLPARSGEQVSLHFPKVLNLFSSKLFRSQAYASVSTYQYCPFELLIKKCKKKSVFSQMSEEKNKSTDHCNSHYKQYLLYFLTAQVHSKDRKDA